MARQAAGNDRSHTPQELQSDSCDHLRAAGCSSAYADAIEHKRRIEHLFARHKARSRPATVSKVAGHSRAASRHGQTRSKVAAEGAAATETSAPTTADGSPDVHPHSRLDRRAVGPQPRRRLARGAGESNVGAVDIARVGVRSVASAGDSVARRGVVDRMAPGAESPRVNQARRIIQYIRIPVEGLGVGDIAGERVGREPAAELPREHPIGGGVEAGFGVAALQAGKAFIFDCSQRRPALPPRVIELVLRHAIPRRP